MNNVMREALYYSKQSGHVKCELCPHNCLIQNEKTGLCGVRKNVNNKLISLSYGRIIPPQIDPVEKKPLYHFLPGTRTLSVGTYGCNFKCVFCQNHELSQEIPENYEFSKTVLPEEIVKLAEHFNTPSISYTYNEPTVFVEYVLECAGLAKKRGIKNILVTNGYTNPKPLSDLAEVVDAVNVDLKSFGEDFYLKKCSARIEPVKNSIRKYYDSGVWVEITTLVIPGENDSSKEMREISSWISSIDRNIPLHLSRFYPHYRMADKNPTPIKTLEHSKGIAEKNLNHVYLGNVPGESNTSCVSCGKILVKRSNYAVKNFSDRGVCSCGKQLCGVY